MLRDSPKVTKNETVIEAELQLRHRAVQLCGLLEVGRPISDRGPDRIA